MDDRRRKRSSRGTKIDDLPSCLITDILSRLPTPSLLSCRVVCKTWYLVFSDPMLVKLHLARSPTYLIRGNDGKLMKFVSRYCSNFTRLNSSSNGLLCLENFMSGDEIYVCNPVLGQYITIPTGNTYRSGRVKSVLGFNSRSNQFKVLQINFPKHNITPYLARIYTIGDGTRQWKSIGIAPSCPQFRFGGFLNGSIHWADEETQQIFYFNFDSEQFGSLPSPPLPPCGDGSRCATVGVLDGFLFCYAGFKTQVMEFWNGGFWIMNEYGVGESWTKIFSIDNTETDQVFSSLHKKLTLLYENCKIQLGGYGIAYNPSFISLQDVAKGEKLTLIS